MIEEFEKKKKSGGKWINALLWVIILILMLLIIFFSLFSLCGVKGHSMNPTLEDGQYVLLLKGHSVQKGRVVVFDNSQQELAGTTGNYNLIKRVIATDGDRIVFAADPLIPEETRTVSLYMETGGVFTLVDESAYLDGGQPMEYVRFVGGRKDGQSYLAYKQFRSGTGAFKVCLAENLGQTLENPDEDCIIEVPPKKFFAMGDNRNHSSDSREYGFFDRSKVVGRSGAMLEQGSFWEKLLRVLFGDKSAG